MAAAEKNRRKEMMSNIILLIVIICTILIILDVSSHLSAELGTKNDQEIIQSTISPTGGPSPTYPPDITPASGYEMGA